MSLLVSREQFRLGIGALINHLKKSGEPYAVIENKQSPSKTFIIVIPGFFINLLRNANMNDMAESIVNTLSEIELRVSETQRRKVEIREEKRNGNGR